MWWWLLAAFIVISITLGALYFTQHTDSKVISSKVTTTTPTNPIVSANLSNLLKNKLISSPEDWEKYKNNWKPSGGIYEKYSVPEDLQESARIAREQFTLTRHDYAKTILNKDCPLLTIVTRHMPHRLALLEINIKSCQNMYTKDFEHVILTDMNNSGMKIAETALYAFKDQYRGKYICHLDDDDTLGNFSIVDEIIRIIKLSESNELNEPTGPTGLNGPTKLNTPPRVIFTKVWETGWNREMPNDEHWFKIPPPGQVTTSNLLIRNDVYNIEENIGAISLQHGGDYAFVFNTLSDCEWNDVFWLDAIIFRIGVDRDKEKLNK